MKILIADKFESAGIDALKAKGFEIIFQPSLAGEALKDCIIAEQPDFLIVRSTKVTADIIEGAKQLKIIVRAGSGYDTIDIEAAGKKSIAVCNCPGTNSTAVAELVMGLILSVDRRIPAQAADLKNGVWNKAKYGKARGIKGQVLGIVGMGRIGRLVARRALAMEMEVIYYDINDCVELDADVHVRHLSLDEVISQADYLTLHVPGGDDTKEMICKRTLDMMKNTAVLINTSRGSVINHDDLYEALTNGNISFAALDVFPNEPTATESTISHPLFELPNFYGTHHVGASTEQAQNAVAEMVVDILATYAEKKEIMHCVNKKFLA